MARDRTWTGLAKARFSQHKSFFRNLWFHTGDGLKRDTDGWYYFVDRLKDALRRRGENISSFEIEQALVTHDLIEEVAAMSAGSAIFWKYVLIAIAMAKKRWSSK